MATKSTNKKSPPHPLLTNLALRDPREGYKTLLVFAYALVADVVAFTWMIQLGKSIRDGHEDDDRYDGGGSSLTTMMMTTFLTLCKAVGAVVLAFHGRIMASYLVHEAAHESIFVTTKPPKVPTPSNDGGGGGFSTKFRIYNFHPIFGTACLWLAGCPYSNFAHVQTMHIAHHRDRTDLVHFDYRTFVNSNPIIRMIYLLLEGCFIPAVETTMHVRQAFLPLVRPTTVSWGRVASSCIGTPAVLFLYWYLYTNGGWLAVMLHLLAGAAVLQFLAFNDSFQHTYEAVFPKDYTPGPGPRTAQYEEENSFSNVVSTSTPIWNAILVLNFGYHNAHHKRPMVPWYGLPAYHDKLYCGEKSSGNSNSNSKGTASGATTEGSSGGEGDKDGKKAPSTKEESKGQPKESSRWSSPQILPMADLVRPWIKHRILRVVDEDYGTVYPLGTPDRTRDFVGALGVSFLSV